MAVVDVVVIVVVVVVVGGALLLFQAFVGCKTQNLIIHHWFSTNLRMRFLRIRPLTWNTEICLRMNVYGCPSDGKYFSWFLMECSYFLNRFYVLFYSCVVFIIPSLSVN